MQVVLGLRPGGLERVVADLVNNSSEELRFVVCCLEEPGLWASQIDPKHGKVVALGKTPGLDWRMVWKIARLARSEGVRIVHTHNAAAHLYGTLGAKLAGAKVVHTEHGKNLGQEARSFRVNRFVAPLTDVYVAVSEKVAKEAVAFERVNPGKLSIIANGIPVESFGQPADRRTLRESLGFPSNGKVIGTVGRLVKEKNYLLLLHAFAKIAPRYPDALLVFAGDGLLRQDLEREAMQLHLDNRVRFLGQRPDVAELLKTLDIFVLSSTTEGMSMALLEAMATGCPIVATAVGGNVELVQDSVTGLLVPPEDVGGLSEAMARLLDDHVLARRLGEAAQRKVQQHYSVQQMALAYEALYRKLAA